MFRKFPYKTTALNVRDFPENTLRRAKSRAAEQGITLRDLTIRLFDLYNSTVIDDILEIGYISDKPTASASPSPSPATYSTFKEDSGPSASPSPEVDEGE